VGKLITEIMEYLTIKESANKHNVSEQTIRRKLANLSQKEKDKHLKNKPLNGRGGSKILISEIYLNSLFSVINELPLQPIQTEKKQTIQTEKETVLQPIQDYTLYIQQIELLRAQLCEKDTQINYLNTHITGLMERLKEANYTLATVTNRLQIVENSTPKTTEKENENISTGQTQKEKINLLIFSMFVLILALILVFFIAQ
jgi:hypothetical protein